MTKTRQYILIIFTILLYSTTLQLNSFFKGHIIEKNKEPDVIQNIFGPMRSFVSDWAFMKAEEYHHRGLPFVGAITYHPGGSSLMSEAQGTKEEGHHNTEEENRDDLFSRVYRSVKVTEDSHLAPSQEKEVLPWFYTEVLFNPHDIRGYVLGGFWLEDMGRYEESMKFLKEGEKNNPDSAQILESIGRLYYHDKKIEEAVSYLESSRQLWLKGKSPNVVTNQYMETDRMVTFELLGSLYEKEGQGDLAIEVYTQLLSFGKYPGVEEKIIKLKSMAQTR